MTYVIFPVQCRIGVEGPILKLLIYFDSINHFVIYELQVTYLMQPIIFSFCRPWLILKGFWGQFTLFKGKGGTQVAPIGETCMSDLAYHGDRHDPSLIYL